MKASADEQQTNGIRIFGMLIPMAPKILLKLLAVFLRFKTMAKKAGKTFHEELITQGVTDETAAKLTKEYLCSADLSQYIHLLHKK